MFLPFLESIFSQRVEIEYKSEQDIHLDCILAENDLFELIERELIHPEADDIGEDGEESAVVLSVGRTWELHEDGIIGYF